MAISIYYAARRKAPLSSNEIAAIQEIVRRYSVDDQIERLLSLGTGLNWESFGYSTNLEPSRFLKKGLVLWGSTKLPDNQEEASWIGVQHWCKCLSEIRLSVSGCEWNVAVEDHEIRWDAVLNSYDPTL
ncbi:hypothetical protein PSCICE_12080 [Pseudomonas cichorii]|nr:hypothetical protein PSCICE_12080 [Pseudomonas cichorii]